eukprot:Phypoly_transcript_09467.p1 GENE.Phypoly_transcript_09467~~Phypoly_transcript_09467.p1  ORF type:complete len:412 (+),score=31.21 Phypoly_transcript_09467:141-1376(+)
MDRTQQALIGVLSLVSLSVLIWIILYFTSPFITPKRKVYIMFMLITTSVSSFFSFYFLLPLPVYVVITSTVFIYWACFIKPGLRPLPFRIFISWPSNLYQGVCILMIPWLWVPWLYWKWLALVISGLMLLGFIQSNILLKEYAYISLNNIPTESLRRKKISYKPAPSITNERPFLRVAQIADPHVGVHMSPERLHNICKTIANWGPDLVFITGDILTVESYFESEKLLHAFSPLSALRGKVFACMGNHDYESQEVVENMLEAIHCTLLKDQDSIVQTPIGNIQIVGTEFTWEYGEAKRARLEQVAEKFSEKKAAYRFWLTHNPDEFRYFPDGSVDLMFSGHTHGGQIGLQCLGINFTMMNLIPFNHSPDFGLWQKGNNLLYVHRGTGFQGFPVRLGVSGELSLVTIFADQM